MGPDEDQFDNGWKDCMSWYFVCDGTWRMLLLVGMSLGYVGQNVVEDMEKERVWE